MFQLSSLVVSPEILVAKGGTMWARNGRLIFAWNARLPRSIQESFTCRKCTTWDRRLYFLSEGRRAEEFFALKNPTVSAGFEPANLGTKANTLPLDHRSRFTFTFTFTFAVWKEEICWICVNGHSVWIKMAFNFDIV